MTTLIIIFSVIIATLLIYLATLDGNFSVSRSLVIDSCQKRLFDKIRDFRSWSDWSPWLMHEPETKLTFSDTPDQEGGWYSWDGKTIGAGKLTHKRFIGERRIEQRIEFKRPFKSVSKVWWEIEPIDENTSRVHWNMAGQMPFLLRIMTRKMVSYISKDYDTGLYMLRGELDAHAEVPRITFDGPTELPAQNALTIHFEGHLDEMKKAMSEGFPKLGEHIEKYNLSTTGNPFTTYYKVDISKIHFNCDMAWPVTKEATSSEFEIKSYPEGRYYKTTLQGSYEFLELAWYQAYTHLQMKKIRLQHKRACLEVYENDPGALENSNELVTAILLPIK
jgi:effector-binding domain-containing protein